MVAALADRLAMIDHALITSDHITLGRCLIQDQHGVRCMSMAMALARALGLHEPEFIDALVQGAFLHDVGKAWVPPWITLKAGKLNAAEYELMKRHTVYGVQYLDAINVNGPVAQIVRHHHERWNGQGYPDGLRGTDIPIAARLMAPIDTYDALRMHRNYQRYDAQGKPLGHAEFSHDEAMRVIEGASGTMFDPRVVKAFCKLKDKEFR